MPPPTSVALLRGPWPGRSLTLAGIAFLVTGLVSSGILHTIDGRVLTRDSTILAIVLALGIVAYALTRIRLATALLGVQVLLLLRFAGAAPVLAVAVLGACAYIIGHRVLGRCAGGSAVMPVVTGMAILIGLIGWLLPFPVHRFSTYGVVAVVILMLGRRQLLTALRRGSHRWRVAVAAAPRWAAFAMLAVGVLAMNLWVPTLQYDDMAYHMLLPQQLWQLHYYRMDAASQVWALAPWASDVWHAAVMILGDGAPRGAANAFWFSLTGVAAWNIGRIVGLNPSLRWIVIALLATQPLLAGLASSMQAETALTALVMTATLLTAILVKRPDRRTFAAFVVTSGLLVGIKATQALIVLPLLAVIVARLGPAKSLRLAGPWLPVALLVAGPSYFYAWRLAGNPLLPLFNGYFQSPFAALSNFDDARWHAGMHAGTIWDVVFHTERYIEGQAAGAAGFSTLGLAGALVASLARRQVRWLALALVVSLLATFAAIQYVRYIVPLQAALIPFAVLGWQACLFGRMGNIALACLAALNALFVPTSSYELRGNLAWRNFDAIGRSREEVSTGLDRQFVPEKTFARQLKMASDDGYSVFLSDPGRPFIAPFGGRAFTLAWYDNAVFQQAGAWNADATGAAWLAFFGRTGMTHVVTGAKTAPAIFEALRQARSIQMYSAGGMSLWRLCGAGATCTLATPTLYQRRDLARTPL
jgi:hypothetical protein